MFGSTILDVAVGLVLVYLILSLICSSLREAIAGLFRTRAKLLEQGIAEMFSDEKLTKAFYDHPQIAALYQGKYDTAKAKGQLPSYIPSRNFALALLDIAARGRDLDKEIDGSARVLDLGNARRYVAEIGNPRIQRVLLTAIDTAQNDFDKALQSVETWFDGSMDRVSGWYRRRTQAVLLAIGLLVTIGVNADTLRIAKHLYTDPAARQAAVAIAGHVLAEPRPEGARAPADTIGTPGTTTSRSVDSTTLRPGAAARPGAVPPSTAAQPTGGVGAGSAADTTKPAPPLPDASARVAFARLDSIGVPLGWPDPKFKGEWLLRIIGWLVTALAISLGAPFWFDTLNRIMVIRSTVKPHEKSPEEASEDRQRPAAVPVVSAPAPAAGGGAPPADAGG